MPLTSRFPEPHTEAWDPTKNTLSSFSHISDVASARPLSPEGSLHLQEEIVGTSLEVHLLRLHHPMQGAQGRSLLRELRSHIHMPCGQKAKT